MLLCEESGPQLALVLIALMRLDVSIVLLDPGLSAATVSIIAVESECAAEITSHLLDTHPLRRALGAVAELTNALPVDCTGTCLTVEREQLLSAWRRRTDALVLWTSGSAGPPKGLVRSGESLIGNTVLSCEAMGYRKDDVLLPLLPISHQYGLSIVIAWWLTGCHLVVGNVRRPTQTIQLALHWGPTIIDSTPPILEDVLTLIERSGLDAIAPTVRMWCVGGSPLSSRLATRSEYVTGLPLLDGYGSTELGNVSLATMNEPSGLGVLLPGVSVEARSESGSVMEPGEIGEIWVRSPFLFSYSLHSGERPETIDGWFCSGDVGSVDLSGRIRIVGRMNAVHRGGFTVHLSSVEQRADECGVPLVLIAEPDDRRGARLIGVLESSNPYAAEESLVQLRGTLAQFEMPNKIVVVASLPRLKNGKIDRVRVAELARGSRRSSGGSE